MSVTLLVVLVVVIMVMLMLMLVWVIACMRLCVRLWLVMRVMALHNAMLTGNDENIGSALRTVCWLVRSAHPMRRRRSIGSDEHLDMFTHAACERA